MRMEGGGVKEEKLKLCVIAPLRWCDPVCEFGWAEGGRVNDEEGSKKQTSRRPNSYLPRLFPQSSDCKHPSHTLSGQSYGGAEY